MQSALGVSPDGKWGPKSQAAAGGLGADEAWSRYNATGSINPRVDPNTGNAYTQKFQSTIMTKEQWKQRTGSNNGFTDYVKNTLVSWLVDERLTDDEAGWIKKTYGL